MANVTTDDIRAFTASRQEAGAANAEINRELAIVKRAFRLAAKGGTVLYVPDIPMPREINVRQGSFERDEFEAVREQLPEPLRPVVTLSYLTGWRPQSEILPLQWSQVDRDAKTIRLEPGTTKNAEGRTFPYGLLPELSETIEKQWNEHERLREAGVICPFVFHREGRPVRDFKDAGKKACEDAGVPGKLRHDFRRTAVRNLVRADVPEKIAMMLTGHKTRAVFDRYDILNESGPSRRRRETSRRREKKGTVCPIRARPRVQKACKWLKKRPGSDWGLVASSDFKSDGPRLIPGTVGSIPTHFRHRESAARLKELAHA